MCVIIDFFILVEDTLLRAHPVPIVTYICCDEIFHICHKLKKFDLWVVVLYLICHSFFANRSETCKLLLWLSYEDSKLVNLLKCLAVNLFSRKLIERLFVTIQSVSLRRGHLDNFFHLTVKLNLENSRVHEQLHCFWIYQILTVSQLSAKVLHLSLLHRRLAEIKNWLR